VSGCKAGKFEVVELNDGRYMGSKSHMGGKGISPTYMDLGVICNWPA